jgi:hypothetical protein
MFYVLSIITEFLKEFLGNASVNGDYATIRKAVFSMLNSTTLVARQCCDQQ